jgi:hypothetical protein
MAPPAVRGVGAVASGTGSITPAYPTAAAPVTNDICVVLAESIGGQNPTLPSGWAHIDSVSPVVVDTTTQLSVLWHRFTAGDPAPLLTDPGTIDHLIGRMIAVSGCPTSGNPWDVVQPSTEATLDTSAAWPAVSTTVIDCLILFCIATGRDLASTAMVGALSGGTGLSAFTEQMDNWVIAGGGGGIGLITAEKAAIGSTGSPVATLAQADAKAFLTLALKPLVAGPATPGRRRPRGRPHYRR